MAAMNISTEASGASAAKRSWRVGERLRHQLRHQRTGVAMDSAEGWDALTVRELLVCIFAVYGRALVFLPSIFVAKATLFAAPIVCAFAAIFQIMKWKSII
ncbi:hypothetical protein GCM10010975_10050 [Comamonas phosphati]|nr:hypothetical protein GCM10010975_10050 [Comamonas phosphati]